ncbi:MAG: NAD(P)-dependent oxidoreductase, partial [Acetobacteraceae bacterium]
ARSPRAGAPLPGVTWHVADLLTTAGRRAALAVAPDTVLHAAWYVAHGRFWMAPENMAWAAASAGLLDEFVRAGGRRFIGLGSCAEYGTEPPGTAPWSETRALAPATLYGLAKASFATRLAGAGISTAWARLFHLFGPAEAPGRLVPSVMAALRAGRPADCASGRPVRDFASTWFTGRALAALAASEVQGAVNVAAGEGLPIGALVGRIGRLSGRPELIRLGALPDRPDEVPSMVAATARLRREVGFTEACDLDADLARLWREELLAAPGGAA